MWCFSPHFINKKNQLVWKCLCCNVPFKLFWKKENYLMNIFLSFLKVSFFCKQNEHMVGLFWSFQKSPEIFHFWFSFILENNFLKKHKTKKQIIKWLYHSLLNLLSCRQKLLKCRSDNDSLQSSSVINWTLI